ncbi:MAG: hypothetical protein IMZ70_07395 [Candidatus Atribacteria bacterium]|nr:hypothetical protein [Candidatus Atribacteria bacterium]
MDRRDFLKKMCIGSVVPAVLALIPAQQTVKAAQGKEPNAMVSLFRLDSYKQYVEEPDWTKEEPDWARAELDRISDVVNHGGVNVIFMSKQLINELNNRFMPMSWLVPGQNTPLNNFAGIPVKMLPMLPIQTERGEVHAIAVNRTPYAIALEDIPKDGYGWVQLMPG